MLFSVVKITSVYFWLFVPLLRLGGTQDISNNHPNKDVQVPPRGSSFSTPAATMMPTYIRHRRALSTETTTSCSTPPQPDNGEYKLDIYFCEANITGCNISEGTALEPGSQLVYSCNPGYRAKGSTDVYCRSRGKWSPIPSCIEVKCASLNSASTMVSCTRFGKWINCDSSVPPETRAEVACRRGYKKDTDFVTTRRGVVNCNINGKWEPDPIRCVPVCGLAITRQQPLIFGATVARIGDFPWHASLFVERTSITGKSKVFICGATIIQTNLVLTAAHCVYDERTKTTENPGNLFVVTGNIFRDYDSAFHDPGIVRKAAVKNVYTYCNYYGLTGNYVSDIALLELQQPLEFSSILLPACLDDSGYSEQFLEPGAYGKVAGFGRTAGGPLSGVLQTLVVPYVSYSQCRASNNAAKNEVFISSDKFCAGYNNGSAVCEGDSGGGLVFKKGDLWYVMGIVSVGLGVDVDDGDRMCDRYSYSLYTKVSAYMTWIQDILFYLERNQPFPPCSSNLKPSLVTSTTPTPTPIATRRVYTTPSITPAVTNWWDKLTSPRPDVTISQTPVASCLAPPQPVNGEWWLHRDFCKETTNCKISEGTALELGSELVYRCARGFKAEGNTAVYCRTGGAWSPIPTCIGVIRTDCECVVYYRCNDTFVMDPDGWSLIDGRFDSPCPGTLDVCCPQSATKPPVEENVTTPRQ